MNPKHESPLSEFIVNAISFLLFLLMLGAVGYAFAEPAYEAENEGVKVMAHSGKCVLKEITNLPHKATWTEKGKVTEGCFGIQRGLVILYFADKTVVVIPASMFVRVTGT